MTVPYYIEYNYKKVEVPQEILRYCDGFTVDADREDLRYIDCVYMHMGYYGTPAHIMKQFRQKYPILPVFE